MEIEEIIKKVESSIVKLDFYDEIRSLNYQYLFSFQIEKVLNTIIETKVANLCQPFFQLLILKLYLDQRYCTRHNSNKYIIQLSLKVKQKYCDLMRHNICKKNVQKLEIIQFMIVLAARMIIIKLLDFRENNQIKMNMEQKLKAKQQIQHIAESSQPQFQEQVYIILIYQTLGSLVSPRSFNILKKKYIKQTFIQLDDRNNVRVIIKSLKQIRQNLTRKQNVFIKNRTDRDKFSKHHIESEDHNCFRCFRRDVKQNLRVKQIQPAQISNKYVQGIQDTLKVYNQDQNSGQRLSYKVIKKKRLLSHTLSFSTNLLLKNPSKSIKNKYKFAIKAIKQNKQCPNSHNKFTKLNESFAKKSKKSNKTLRNVKQWENTISNLKLSSHRDLSGVQKLSSLTSSLNTTQRDQFKDLKNIPSLRQIVQSKNINKYRQQMQQREPPKVRQRVIRNQQLTLDGINSKYINLQSQIVYADDNFACTFMRKRGHKKTQLSQILRRDEKSFYNHCRKRNQMVQQYENFYRK